MTAIVNFASNHERGRPLSDQIRAMGSAVFELGLFTANPANREVSMIPRVWDAATVIRAESWLRYQNLSGRNIYIRPKGEHNLTMIDDLAEASIVMMKSAGFNPALVVETSPGNFQAWLKHNEILDKRLGTAVARSLAERFGGDRGAADWRHFGRLAGFTNRKPKHLNPSSGLYPFVRLIQATGEVYPEAESFVSDVKRELDRQRELLERRRSGVPRIVERSRDLKAIDAFRSDTRYGGDATRVDLAYSVYALAHGLSTEEVGNAIRSRDLSHKGTERRQEEYVARTIKKALAAIDRGR